MKFRQKLEKQRNKLFCNNLTFQFKKVLLLREGLFFLYIMKVTFLVKVLGLMILAIILAKFIHIEADPWAIKSTSDIHDEAWWAENARLKVQENKWVKDDIAGGLAVSPVINLIYYSSFKIFGISFFSLRIFSVLASILNIALYYLLSKRYLNTQKEALTSSLLFASIPIYFIIGRTGLIETGLISMLLISILLVLQNNKWLVLMAGVSVAIGMQLKGSFLFLIPIVVYLLYTKKNAVIKKDFFLFGIGAVFISTLFLVFYYLPNLSLFQPYYNAFRSEFYSIKELINPAGITIRLGYFFSKESITDPFIFILILLFFYRIIYYKLEKELSKLVVAFLIGFACILFSDFNDKRILLLCICFPIFIVNSVSERRELNLKTLRSVAFFCSFSIFPSMPNIQQINWKEPYLVGISIDSILIFTLALSTLFVIFLKLEKGKLSKDISVFFYLMFVIIFLSKSLSIIILNSFNLDTNPTFSFIIAVLLIIIIYYLLFKNKLTVNFAISILIGIQISFISIQLYSDTFEIKKVNTLFAKIGKSNERMIGPNSIFEISFLSKTHPIYFSNTGNIGKNVSKNEIVWYGAITNKEYSEVNLQADLKLAERKLKIHFVPYHSQKIYKNKCNVMIFRVLDIQLINLH